MKKFILIAVLLQLCLTVLDVNAGGGASARRPTGEAVNENQPQFGDLIEFPKQKMNAKLYSHYGIYVGGKDLVGKTDENIFEMTRDPPGCRFSKIKGPFKIVNHYYNDPPQTEAGMKGTIETLMGPDSNRCKEYSLLEENCEMVATLVRYGLAMCKQTGTIVESLSRLTKSRTKRQKSKQKRHEASAAA